MNRIAIASVIAAAACAAATGARADTFFDTARVRTVEPVFETVSVPREQCSVTTVNETHRVGGPTQGPNVAGAVIGGVAGGILGNQVGKGTGRDVATGLGVVLGAFAGDRVAGANNRPEQYETVPRQVQQCQTVQELQQRQTGFRVGYEYRGQNYTTVMRDNPGPNLQVRVSVDPVVR